MAVDEEGRIVESTDESVSELEETEEVIEDEVYTITNIGLPLLPVFSKLIQLFIIVFSRADKAGSLPLAHAQM